MVSNAHIQLGTRRFSLQSDILFPLIYDPDNAPLFLCFYVF